MAILYAQSSPLNGRNRQDLLQNLCWVTEIYSFVQDRQKWAERGGGSLPQEEDDLVIWQSILFFRSFFCRIDPALDVGMVRERVDRLRLQLASVALKQGNLSLADGIYRGSIVDGCPQQLAPFWTLIQQRISILQLSSSTAKLATIIRAKKSIDPVTFQLSSTDQQFGKYSWPAGQPNYMA